MIGGELEMDEKFNKDDVKKYYELLNHSVETELRTYNNKSIVPAKKYFIHGATDFADKVESLSGGDFNISAGINERNEQKSGDDDVKYFSAVLLDLDAHGSAEILEDTEKRAQDLLIKLAGANIKASMAFSGRGYHIIIPFKKIEVTDDNRDELKQKLKILRQYFVDKFGVDNATFNLSRMSRVIGTYNITAGKISYWIDYQGYNDNFDFIDLINALYKQREIVQGSGEETELNENNEAHRKCKFFDEVASTTKLPEGERHNVLIKNLSVYSNFTGNKKVRDEFCKVQGINASEFGGWDAAFKDGSFKKFNCGEISNYCKRNQLKDKCFLCEFNNFRCDPKKIAFDTRRAHKAKFVVNKNIFQAGKTIIGQYGVLTKSKLYNVFESLLLVGNPNNYIITINDSDLREGDADTFLIPLKNNPYLYKLFTENPPEDKILLKMGTNFGLSKKNTEKKLDDGTLFTWLIEEDEKRLDSYFLCLSGGVDEDDIKSLTNEDTKEIVENYITLGLNIDSTVKLCMESDFFIPDINTADIRLYQFYNNHKFLFTDTKAGKTTISSRIGHNSIRTTIKNLLGFATADEVIRGTLNNNIYPYYLDELQEDSSKVMYGKLLSYMESGSVNIDVGRKSINCSGFSALTFLGNPKETFNENKKENLKDASMIEIVRQFDSTLKLITDNYVALGSRIGLVVFNPETKRVSGDAKFTGDEYDILHAKFEYLRKTASPMFNKILRDKQVKAFLDTPFDDNYSEAIQLFSKKASIHSIRDFMSGSLSSYRHLNGTAVRLACLDYLHDIVNNDYDANKIIAQANIYLAQCKSINMQSFKRFVDNKVLDEFFMKGYKSSFDNDSIDTKVILSSLYEYLRANGKTETIYMKDIKQNIIENSYRPEDKSANYIMERVNSKVLEHQYGIELHSFDTIPYFVIKDFAPLIYIFGDFAETNIFSKPKEGQAKL